MSCKSCKCKKSYHLSLDVTKLLPYLITVKPVLSDRIQQDVCLAFQIGDWLLLHKISAESSFLNYFYSAIINQ